MSDPQSAPAPAPTGAFATDPNYAKLDPELQSHFKSKGWDVRTPFEAAVETMKSYRELEKHFGTPAAQLAKIPKDATDVEGWKALNTKLGVPEKVEGYDFSKIKHADGSDIDSKSADAMKQAALTAGIPASRAQDFVNQLVKFQDGAKTDEQAVKIAALTEQRAAWVKTCGPNLQANEFIADQAAQKLGWGPEFFAALKEMSVIGADKVMAGLLKAGQMMGEDRFVANPNSPTPGVMTKEQANTRLTELKADSAWVTKLNNGDTKTNQEFEALCRLIV